MAARVLQSVLKANVAGGRREARTYQGLPQTPHDLPLSLADVNMCYYVAVHNCDAVHNCELEFLNLLWSYSVAFCASIFHVYDVGVDVCSPQPFVIESASGDVQLTPPSTMESF